MRFDAYDNHFKELHIKSKEKEVIEWESEQLKFAKQRCNYHNDTLQKLHDAPERDQKQADGTVIKGIPLDKKVDSEAENQRAYDKSLDSVYKLLFGGVVKRENHNHNDNSTVFAFAVFFRIIPVYTFPLLTLFFIFCTP